MSQTNESLLKQQFPDLNTSTISDVLGQCRGNMSLAQDILKESEQEKLKQRASKVNELKSNFQDLENEVISRVLEENDDDVDKAILPLFELLEKKNDEKRIKEVEQQRKKNREVARKQAQEFLTQLYSKIPQEHIQRILDENEGDVELTTVQLSKLIVEKEKKAEDEQKKKLLATRQIAIEALQARFSSNIHEDEIVQILEVNDWNVKTAANSLLKLSDKRHKEKLCALYKDFSELEIENALKATNWSPTDAARHLDQLRNKLKDEQKELEKPTDNIQEILSTQFHQKLNLEHQEKNSSKEFLLRSIQLDNQIHEIIQVQQLEQDPLEIFKQELESKFRNGPNPSPGLIAKPQEFTQSEPPSTTHTSEEVVQTEKKTSPVQASAAQLEIITIDATPNKFNFSATPSRVDIGNDIQISWTENDEASPNDWIAVYDKNSDTPNNYVDWQWIGKPTKEGSLTFKVPVMGTYFFRYLSKKSYTQLAQSNFVEVGPEFKLTTSKIDDLKYSIKYEQISGNQYVNAWIGLYRKDEQNHQNYYSYQWLINSTNHTLIFDVPKAGDWEFRLFPFRNLFGGYYPVAVCPFSIQGVDDLDLKIDEEQKLAIIKLALITVDPARDNVWVGLFLENEKNNRQWRRYKSITTSDVDGKKCIVTFKKPIHNGIYEARLFANGSYDNIVAKSNTVDIKDGI